MQGEVPLLTSQQDRLNLYPEFPELTMVASLHLKFLKFICYIAAKKIEGDIMMKFLQNNEKKVGEK